VCPAPPEKIGEVAYLHVKYAIDGDTLKVCDREEDENAQCFSTRFIGADTPETKHRKKGVQRCGPEASKITESLVGKKLKFEFLPPELPHVKVDRYHRPLSYVYLPDGTLYNEKLIRDGYAHHNTKYHDDYKYRDRFEAAQKEASEKKRGIWSTDQCAAVPDKVPKKTQ